MHPKKFSLAPRKTGLIRLDPKIEKVCLTLGDINREIARWSTSDGRCLAVNPNGFLGTPKSLKVSTQVENTVCLRISELGCLTYLLQFSVSYLFCSGDTKDVFILDVTSLEVGINKVYGSKLAHTLMFLLVVQVLRVWGGHGNFVTFTDFYDPGKKGLEWRKRTSLLRREAILHNSPEEEPSGDFDSGWLSACVGF